MKENGKIIKEKEGYGIDYFSDGEKYEGEWRNDILDGYGIYFFSSGDNMKENGKIIKNMGME